MNKSQEDRLDRLTELLDRLLEVFQVKMLTGNQFVPPDKPLAVADKPLVAADAPPKTFAEFDEENYQRWRTRLLKDPTVLKILATQKEIIVETKYVQIVMEDQTLPGRVAKLVAFHFFDSPRMTADVKKQLERTGSQINGSNLARTLSDLVNKGFLTREGHAFLGVPGMKVRIVGAVNRADANS